MKSALAVVCVALLAAARAVCAADAGVRTWTSVSGQTVEASFVKMEAGMVHLQRAGGETVGIPLSRLCQADQAVARELAGVAPADAPAVKSSMAVKAAPASRAAGDTLTEEEIAALKTEWRDERGRGMNIEATFTLDDVRAKEEASRFSKSGKVPVRITVALYETRESGGREVRRLLPGRCRLYVQDSEGNLVFKATENLDKMCPS